MTGLGRSICQLGVKSTHCEMAECGQKRSVVRADWPPDSGRAFVSYRRWLPIHKASATMPHKAAGGAEWPRAAVRRWAIVRRTYSSAMRHLIVVLLKPPVRLWKAGVTCWIAPRDVTPGAFYGDEIVHAIDAAKAIVLILSQHAAASPHVLREVERAASKRHTVISLRIDKAPLPPGLEYFLNTSQWLDASSGDTVRALPRLVSAVKVAIQAPAVTPTSVPSTHAPAPTVAAQSPKKIGIIVASAIGLGLLAFAATS